MASWKNKFPKENRYWESKNGILYCGDCLEIMKEFPKKSIDLVLTDPPYNISRKTNFASMERYNSYKGMDFGEWDKGFDITGWIKYLPLKDNSNFVCFNSWQNLKPIADECIKNGIIPKRPIVINKINPMPVNRDRLFVNSLEFGIWATKGKWTFNRTEKYEVALFNCPNVSNIKHPTAKHISPIKKLISVLSNKQDIILDPFGGSGTTALACENLNRRWILIELNKTYCELIIERIGGELWKKSF